MAISRRATGTATNASSTNIVSPSWDLVPTDGDQLLAAVGAIVQATMTPPAGWTLLGTQDSGANVRTWYYSKTASSEPSGYTWTLGTSTKNWAWTGAYAGADPSTVALLSGTSLTTPSIAVPANGWLVTGAAGRHSNTGSPTSWTTSDGLDSERLDFGSNVTASNDVSGCVYDSNRALSAANYTRTLTPSQTETLIASFAFAFGPTGGGGGGGGSAGAGWGIHL